MKKVTVFVGSARKKLTYYAVTKFLENMQSLGEIEHEIVILSHHRIGTCRGCLLCFEKGEEICPLHDDDRDALIAKIMASDGVVIATPNYSFQVSANTKIVLDRLGFVFHRPRFFGKAFTSIVAQGIMGGNKIVEYLDFVGNALCLNAVKGCCVTACDPMTEREKQKIDKALGGLSKRFHETLMKPEYPAPSLLKLWGFRMGRTYVKRTLDDTKLDYRYYKERGWFDSDFFYPVHLGVLKKAAGGLFDSMARRSVKKKEALGGTIKSV